MEVIYENGGALVSGLDCFDPGQTFACGQCFRFWPQPDESYLGVAAGKAIAVKRMKDGLFLFPCDKEQFEAFWSHYFDLHRDYREVRGSIARTPVIASAMEFGKGIRILNQPPFETLITFIASARNNVKRISLIVENLCRRYGDKIGGDLYAFPAPAALAQASEEDLRELGAGYRAPFIAGSSKMALHEDWDAIRNMPYPKAKAHLMHYPGVGEKVANCVLLFSLGFFHAFPVDVWIKRILETHLRRPLSPGEGEKLGWEWFGEYGGLAQQYLFYEARQKNKKTKEHRK
ncbi:MAG: DNA-3-methyladenine glycosylase family protein [Christensenellales bacterium]